MKTNFVKLVLAIFIFIGRLTEQKGIDIMLEAVKPFLAKKARCVIVGSGNDLYTRKIKEFQVIL